jgi:hypothetical protein
MVAITNSGSAKATANATINPRPKTGGATAEGFYQGRLFWNPAWATILSL